MTAAEGGETFNIPRVGAVYAAPAPLPANTAVEYYHVDFEHYFVTSFATEIADLDAAKYYGWARTGETFKVFPLGEAGTVNACRFFSEAFAPRSSALLQLRLALHGPQERSDVEVRRRGVRFPPAGCVRQLPGRLRAALSLLQQRGRRGAEPPLHDQPARARADAPRGMGAGRDTSHVRLHLRAAVAARFICRWRGRTADASMSRQGRAG
ncbi:MAG: hypothetical protein MZW92_33170 [Comamonadaceae bacterium]|nr:hypothetical protein [Comamonadaceae bacterium]